jgi:hypothetical protein
LIGATVYQAVYAFFSTDAFGTVTHNPPYSTSTFGCNSGYPCRYSDAALVRIASGVQSDLGGIARTTGGPVLLPTVYGSVTIDATNPRIAISGVVSSLFVGDSLHKVGRTTGWTYGYLESTCRDVTLLNGDGTRFTTLCAGVVDAGSGGGDSGAPVFWQGTSGDYFMAGILFGG